MPDDFQQPSDPPVRSTECSADEHDQRLMLAEEILSDLATGYWVSVMDDNDDPVKERMGQRILNYWRKWDSPTNESSSPTASPEEDAMTPTNSVTPKPTAEAESGAAVRSSTGLECADFQEHPGWRNNHDKTVGVTWDAWCSKCGFRLENKPWANGLAIEGEGRRLAHVVSVAIIAGESFTSNKRKIVCSKCCPVILGGNDD